MVWTLAGWLVGWLVCRVVRVPGVRRGEGGRVFCGLHGFHDVHWHPPVRRGHPARPQVPKGGIQGGLAGVPQGLRDATPTGPGKSKSKDGDKIR